MVVEVAHAQLHGVGGLVAHAERIDDRVRVGQFEADRGLGRRGLVVGDAGHEGEAVLQVILGAQAQGVGILPVLVLGAVKGHEQHRVGQRRGIGEVQVLVVGPEGAVVFQFHRQLIGEGIGGGHGENGRQRDLHAGVAGVESGSGRGAQGGVALDPQVHLAAVGDAQVQPLHRFDRERQVVARLPGVAFHVAGGGNARGHLAGALHLAVDEHGAGAGADGHLVRNLIGHGRVELEDLEGELLGKGPREGVLPALGQAARGGEGEAGAQAVVVRRDREQGRHEEVFLLRIAVVQAGAAVRVLDRGEVDPGGVGLDLGRGVEPGHVRRVEIAGVGAGRVGHVAAGPGGGIHRLLGNAVPRRQGRAGGGQQNQACECQCAAHAFPPMC